MGTNKTKSKSSLLAADEKFLAGIVKHLGKNGSLVIEQEKVSGAEIVAMVRANIEAIQASETARATWKRLVRAERAQKDSTAYKLSLVRKALLVLYGSADEILADFGLARPKTRHPLTSDELAAKVAKQRKTLGIIPEPKHANGAPTTNGTGPQPTPQP